MTGLIDANDTAAPKTPQVFVPSANDLLAETHRTSTGGLSTGGAPLPVVDSNNAAYGSPLLMTSGQPMAAGKGVLIIATSVGIINLAFANGLTIPYPITATGPQELGFSIISYTFSGGAAGTVYNL